MDVMMGDEEIDSIYINFVTPFFVDTNSIAREIAEVNKQRKKPIICNLMTDKGQWTETVRILKEGGVPCYGFPGTAARALVALTQYNRIRNRKTGEVKRFDDVDRQKAEAILEEAKQAGRKILSAADGYEILNAYGIPAAEWRIADTAADAEKAASEIGFPVVAKLDSWSVPRKSDVGAVALNLRDAGALRSAIEE
ncbi:MAG TPA: CoA-binding protein, partial [Syntrophorhabdus aromaticivorans]|nr:CoA-binding protein [Syntrophorhabdus aromaticivorans]